MNGKKAAEGLFDVLDILNDPFDESGERDARKGSKERAKVVAYLQRQAELIQGESSVAATTLRAVALDIGQGKHTR